jgi:hypothetical protein
LQISAHYAPDLKRTYRAIVRLRRRGIRGMRVFGVVCGLLAVLAGSVGRQSAGIVALIAMYGLVFITVPPFSLWLLLRRSRAAIEMEVDLEVTDLGITRKTATQTTHVTWEMVQRVIDCSDFWIFKINRLQNVVLWKSVLTAEQCAELAVFLASRAGSATSVGAGN